MRSIFPAAAILLAQAQPDPAEKWSFERGQKGAQLCEGTETDLVLIQCHSGVTTVRDSPTLTSRRNAADTTFPLRLSDCGRTGMNEAATSNAQTRNQQIYDPNGQASGEPGRALRRGGGPAARPDRQARTHPVVAQPPQA